MITNFRYDYESDYDYRQQDSRQWRQPPTASLKEKQEYAVIADPEIDRQFLSGAKVPALPGVRTRMRNAATGYVRREQIVAPVTLNELERHALVLLEELEMSRLFLAFGMLLVANASWRNVLAGIPFDRRLLLLPLCLRHSKHCVAEVDGVGLLCAECGECAIQKIQNEAESLGYVVLVAEGTTVVKRLIESGKIDAVVGVGCLDALAKTFSSMVTHAVPGLAVPLLNDGCTDTRVDTEWLLDELGAQPPVLSPALPDLDALRSEVDAWFENEKLAEYKDAVEGETSREAWGWVATGGKRWRPVLAVATYRALGGESLPAIEHPLALAVECFHKASLVHDDIQDDEETRYGAPAVHRRIGIPQAINVGDYLLGEGYRLLAQVDVLPQRIGPMVAAAAAGHVALCKGQGIELAWRKWPVNRPPAEIIEQFALKTSPAFEVALLLGAIAAGADAHVQQSLRDFSRALGIAYQVRDDIEDQEHGVAGAPLDVSLLEALRAHGEEPTARAEQLYEHYRNAALRKLSSLGSAPLGGLLRRLTVRILKRREQQA